MTRPVLSERSKIALTDHAFFQMLQEDRAFRQALVLDLQTTLEPFSLSPRARQRVEIIITQLDELTEILVEKWVESSELKKLLSDPQGRRVLLFSPLQAGLRTKLSGTAAAELQDLTEKANILCEGLLA